MNLNYNPWKIKFSSSSSSSSSSSLSLSLSLSLSVLVVDFCHISLPFLMQHRSDDAITTTLCT